jgi:hypothetical protein
MPLPTCQHCNTREATGFHWIKGLTVLWLCGTCFGTYDPEAVSRKFGEPTIGDLFAPEDE